MQISKKQRNYLCCMDLDLRKKENLHVTFWLVKDFAWISDFHALAISMIIPTFLLAIYLTWKSWFAYKFKNSDDSDFYHNLAVTFWIVGNSIWMIGEFYFNDEIRPIARPAFLSGLAVVGFFYLRKWLRAMAKG